MTFKNILGTIDLDEAWKHLEWMNEHAPRRVPGAGGQEAAAAYCAEKLKEYGFEARLDSFTAYRCLEERATLHVLTPDKREFPCAPASHMASTPDDGIEVELLHVGDGSEGQYEGKQVDGSAVVVEVGANPALDAKARVAAARGARAILFVSRKAPQSDVISHTSIRGAWGNPTRASIADIPRITAVGVSRTTGDEIISMSTQGAVRARLMAKVRCDWGPLLQPIGRLKAPSNVTGDFLVVGGHYDAFEPGVTNNAAGNALMLELARVFAAHRETLRRDIFVCFWNGHATGGHDGSIWFADRYWDHLDEHAVAHFNVESVGLALSSAYVGASTPELTKWHRRIEQQVLGSPTRFRHLRREHAHPFFDLGLPALEGRFHFTEEQISDWDGAKDGWWRTTKYDTLDKLDRERFADTAHIYARYIWDMCSLPVLPMDFTNNATRVDKAVSAMQKRGKDRFQLDLPTAKFLLAATRLSAATKGAREDQQVISLNRTLKKLSRLITPAFETARGPYANGRRSRDAFNSPIPAVHAMRLLASVPPGEELSHLLYTELLRERNRLSDALRQATASINNLLDQ